MSGTYREPARDIPIRGEYDVIVVGGGCAGLAAAISSARAGARTLVIERFPFLGGTATASLMANINGYRNQVEPDSVQTVRGIAEEIMLKLNEMGGLGQSPYPQKDYDIEKGELAYSYAIDTERFKHVVLSMMREAGADILFHTMFCDAIVEDGAVAGVVVENKSGREAYRASVVVDASGDADVAARAGAEFWQVRHDEAPRLSDALMYRIAGVAEGSDLGGCPTENGTIVWGPGGFMEDGTDAVELTEAEVDARLKVRVHFQSLKAKNTGMENAYVAETPALIGVRQTRFVEGTYKLTAIDALEGARFDDVVAISSCAIIHYYGYRRYLEHEGFDIPYRCLVPKAVDGLLIAGRCISSEQQPYESFRAMAPVTAIGEAAGRAAAMAVETNVRPRDLDVPELQKRLIAQGVELRREAM
jgi:hypothetical protein